LYFLTSPQVIADTVNKMIETLNKTEIKQSKTIGLAVREKWTIVRLSRSLGRTIAETSRMLGSLAKQNEKLKELFVNLDWPLGHIYIGDKHIQNGERSELIKIGSHVIAGRTFSNQQNVEIFSPIKTVQTLCYFGHNVNNKLVRVSKQWFSDGDIKRGRHKAYGKSHKCTKWLKSKHIRTIYKKGHWVGTPNIRSIVGVNYNWK